MTSLLIDTGKLGLALFIIGLALLLISFGLAYNAYVYSETQVSFGGDILEVFTSLLRIIARLLPKIIWIAVMVAIGSLVLSKGISLLTSKPSAEEKFSESISGEQL